MPRKETLGKRYTMIRNKVRKSLEQKQIYDETDDILIDELCYNIKLADDAKKDIKTHGFKQNVTKDPTKDPHYQQNPSVSSYLQFSKNISSLLTKLGLTAQERVKLEIESKPEDPLTRLFNQTQDSKQQH